MVLERLVTEPKAGNVALTEEELDLAKGRQTGNKGQIHKRFDTDLADK